jgi:DNA-directed RNA polymerase subunit RPC12/RpoP
MDGAAEEERLTVTEPQSPRERAIAALKEVREDLEAQINDINGALRALGIEGPQPPTPEPKKEYLCSVCSRAFKSNAARGSHEYQAHRKPAQEPVPCPVCHSTFKNKSGLGAHLRTHKEDSADTANRWTAPREVDGASVKMGTP